MLQMTRRSDGRSVEFPKDRENQNQILERLRWKRKKKEKTCGVFLIHGNVKFHPWRVNKDFLGKQEGYLLKRDPE